MEATTAERLEALEKRMAVTKETFLKMSDILMDLSKAVNMLDKRINELKESQPKWHPEDD